MEDEHWLTIEVGDTQLQSARSWRDAWFQSVVAAALEHGCKDWGVQPTSWGIVFEFSFEHEVQRNSFEDLALLKSALDAAPDPDRALHVYRGRGGSALVPVARPHQPFMDSGAAAVPTPEPDRPPLQAKGRHLEVVESFTAPRQGRRAG